MLETIRLTMSLATSTFDFSPNECCTSFLSMIVILFVSWPNPAPLSFNEFKKQADSNGYHTMQTTKFLHYFCELGMNITNYVELIVLFKEKDLESFDYDSSTRIPGVPKENRLNIK